VFNRTDPQPTDSKFWGFESKVLSGVFLCPWISVNDNKLFILFIPSIVSMVFAVKLQ